MFKRADPAIHLMLHFELVFVAMNVVSPLFWN
jgi:hypothetical protein